jgi:hypothetical protein
MSELTPILSMPLIQAAQAQKHVTHNEALMRLDVMVQLSVTNRSLTAPPPSPVLGQRHIVAPSPTGDWTGQAAKIAFWLDGVWHFVTPLTGWKAWVTAEGIEVFFNGTVWAAAAGASIPSVLAVNEIGVSTASDATNRFALSSPAALFNHAGAGHQVKINKAAVADTGSLLFQTGFSGRAEMGLLGNNNFTMKVSSNGSTYTDALKIAATTGEVELTKPVLLTGQAAAPASPVNGMLWHDSTRGQLMARIGGQSRAIDEQVALPCLIPPATEWVMTTMACGSATTVLAGAANRVDLFPFVPCADISMDQLGVNVTTAVAAALGKIVVYNSLANGRPDALLLETGTLDFATVGNKSIAASLTLLRGRTYWLGIRHSSTAALSAWATSATPDINGGTTFTTTARKVLRRTLTFATAAPASWGFLSSEINAGSATSIWLRAV